ncbi:hypothetical protein C9J85_09565 [Haloferax sp. wsp5]|nr:hypothetical protein C9J85_09565 [Haloferax sp. wsp5]
MRWSGWFGCCSTTNAPWRPSGRVLDVAVAVVEPLQAGLHEVEHRGLDVRHRQEVEIEVVAGRLARSLVCLADAEADRTAHHGGPVRRPSEFAHFVGFRRRPADVLAGNGHAADVYHEVGGLNVSPDCVVLPEFVDGVIRYLLAGDAGIDERAGGVPRIRRDVRRHPEVRGLVDVAVDDGHVERLGVSHTRRLTFDT